MDKVLFSQDNIFFTGSQKSLIWGAHFPPAHYADLPTHPDSWYVPKTHGIGPFWVKGGGGGDEAQKFPNSHQPSKVAEWWMQTDVWAQKCANMTTTMWSSMLPLASWNTVSQGPPVRG